MHPRAGGDSLLGCGARNNSEPEFGPDSAALEGALANWHRNTADTLFGTVAPVQIPVLVILRRGQGLAMALPLGDGGSRCDGVFGTCRGGKQSFILALTQTEAL